MTGILVALLVIVTAALCFLLGMIYGVALKEEFEKKRFEQTMTKAVNSDLWRELRKVNEQDWKEKTK
jgi:predicted Holliday junction resolvase-like endonuclease